MTPSSVLLTMASSEDSTTAASRTCNSAALRALGYIAKTPDAAYGAIVEDLNL